MDFLEAEGCFHLPTRKIMDQIVRQYFLHVHPLLPIVNEGDFWEMYYNKRTNEPLSMSLLVFQAMMFVSCNVSAACPICRAGPYSFFFVPCADDLLCKFVNWSPESTRSIGYKNIRGLRATFYRRAKVRQPQLTSFSEWMLTLDLASLRFWHRVVTSSHCPSSTLTFVLDAADKN